jgi:Domain of unknown function (DUF1854)
MNDSDQFALECDEWNRLSLVDGDGASYADVRAVPLFPITDPEHWIAICDRSGRELTCIINPLTLTEKTHAVLDHELARREFLPIIHRIVGVSGNSEPCAWEVETDRGPTCFVLQREEDVRRLGTNRVSVTAASGVRFLINDVTGLDRKSRRVVDWYV